MRRLFALFALVALPAAAARAQSGLFIVTSDFSTGSTAFLAPGASEAETNLLGVHSDAVARYHAGRIYVINRLGQDNIAVLDEGDLRAVVAQYSVGNGSNPHDIEVVSEERAYVTRYETAELLEIDPRDGRELGRIDLSAFADADGLPEVSQIARVGQRLYLSCQRLDRNGGWAPVGDSYLIVVDIDDNRLVDVDPAADGVQGIALSAPNPNSLAVVGERIAVGVVAGFGDRNGGVDLIDARQNRSLGLVVGEAELGGDINSLVMVDDELGYAVVADENFVNSVRSFNVRTGAVGAPLEGLSGGFIATMAVDGDRLIVGDQGSFADPAAAGLRIYDARSGAFLQGPISTGLPPASIAVLGAAPMPTAVLEEGARPQRAGLGRAYPNPFNGSVVIPFAVRGAGPVELAIYDALGRRVRTLVAGALSGGGHTRVWDGRDDSGRKVGSGTYLAAWRAGGRRQSAKLVLLK